MMYNAKTVGQILKDARMEKQISQDVLSGFAVITRSHLSDIETGKATPKLDTLWKLAESLDLRPSELIASMERGMEHKK